MTNKPLKLFTIGNLILALIGLGLGLAMKNQRDGLLEHRRLLIESVQQITENADYPEREEFLSVLARTGGEHLADQKQALNTFASNLVQQTPPASIDTTPLETRIEDLERQLEEARTRAKNDAGANEQITAIKRRLTEQAKDLMQRDKTIEELKDANTLLQSEIKRARQSLLRQKETIAALETSAAEKSQPRPAPEPTPTPAPIAPVVAKATPTPNPSPALPGSDVDAGVVLRVNSEWNYVIVNRGSNAGVTMQQRGQVTRGGSVLSGFRVIRVQESLSVCKLTEEGASANIRKGDTASF